MIRKLALSILSACISLAALYAQGIDAQVQVTGDYESSLGRLAKQGMQMHVPDSAYRFNYSFDYAVFDSPYKGAYEFSPYTVKIVPEAVKTPSRVLSLKAGAGYSLNPLLQAVWSPVPKGDFSLTLHQDLHGYLGGYWTMGGDLKPTRYRWFGSDLSEALGLNLAWRKKSFTATIDTDYRGIYTYEPTLADYTNALGIRGRIRSNVTHGSGFFYDVALSASALNDYAVTVLDPVSLFQCSYALEGTVGPVIKGVDLFTVDFKARHDDYYQVYNSCATLLSVTPRFSFAYKRLKLIIGATAAWAGEMHICPNVSLRGGFPGGVLDIEAGVKGGVVMNDFYSYKDRWSRFNVSFTSDISALTLERFNAYLMAEGRLGRHFQYGIKGGYAGLASAPMLGVAFSGTQLRPQLEYLSFNYAYADASAAWVSERLEVTGSLALRKTELGGTGRAFDYPLFAGGVSVRYNWLGRIWAGASFRGETARSMAGYTIPAYGDLGISVEYRLPRLWGFWIEGSNLMDNFIQRVPGFAERGINIAAGVSLYL